jgi:1-acyl-sn-glycerol-3-phosphate acyltransferase
VRPCAAVAVLCVWVALAVLPNKPPFPRWGLAVARAICQAAQSYFPLSLEFEDEAGYLAAAKAGIPTVIGLEPHSVLPLSIVTFGKYFLHSDSTPPEIRNSRALATGTIFIVPLLRQLWSWLGMDPISRGYMRQLLEEKRTVIIIPGGVAECLQMREGVETIYLRKRFGFVKLAIQTGAQLVPAFTFGQCNAYKYYRLGPPLCSEKIVAAISRVMRFAPIVFWGKWGTPIPHQTPMHSVVGKAIPVTRNENPSSEEVEAKLAEFIDAMQALFYKHRASHGFAHTELRVL